MAMKISSLDDQKCLNAVGVIRDLISRECQGFILPPAEVRRLLGIPIHYQTWYLHRNVLELRKKLANNFISVNVDPRHGICFALYHIHGQAGARPKQVN